MKKHIHIFGASGSGTTTIAQVVCNKLNYKHFDSDYYFWLQTKEPFTVERPRDKCMQFMKDDLINYDKWILSGSLTNWGNALIPFFDLVVFVYVPQETRIERLKKREYERYGDEVLSGGSRYDSSNEFLQWAAAYDSGTKNGRSLQKHKLWLNEIKCPVLRITNNKLEDSVNAVIEAIHNRTTILD